MRGLRRSVASLEHLRLVGLEHHRPVLGGLDVVPHERELVAVVLQSAERPVQREGSRHERHAWKAAFSHIRRAHVFHHLLDHHPLENPLVVLSLRVLRDEQLPRLGDVRLGEGPVPTETLRREDDGAALPRRRQQRDRDGAAGRDHRNVGEERLAEHELGWLPEVRLQRGAYAPLPEELHPTAFDPHLLEWAALRREPVTRLELRTHEHWRTNERIPRKHFLHLSSCRKTSISCAAGRRPRFHAP